MKVIAFAATSHTLSINKKLVTYACSFAKSKDADILDINDYEMPLFSQDKEKDIGQPKLAHDFLKKIADCDAIIISFAEHNGTYTAAYKNLFDWCSRIEPKVFQNKPMVLLSTSPGARGGASVLAQAVQSAPFFNGIVKASLSIPSFYENFDMESNSLINKELVVQLKDAINQL